MFDNVTGAFPNLLESITIKDDLAYIPGTCSSPNGPFRFNVNVQSCLSTIDIKQKTEAFKTLNMNVGVNFEPVGKKLFNTNPFAVAFKRSADEGFIALGATNRLLRVTLNDDGSPTINPPLNANDPGNIVRIELKDPGEIGLADPDDTIGGQNPRGVVLNSNDTRAYVMDFLSRDIAIVDVSGNDPHALQDARAQCSRPICRRPAPMQATVQRGKYLFNTAIGPEGTPAELGAPVGPDVRHRVGDLLQLPPERADRHGHVDVRRWSAAGDLDGEHVRVRRGEDREWRAACCPIRISAR